MNRIRRAARIALSQARGDWLTASGKLATLSYGAVACGIAYFLTLPFVEEPQSYLVWAAFTLAVGYWATRWVLYEPKNPCPGPRNLYTSPSGEVSVFICHGCESWGIAVRGEGKGDGQGVKDFAKRLRDLAHTHDRNVPHLASELRQAADSAEEDGSLEFNERYQAMAGFSGGDEPVALLDVIRQAMSADPDGDEPEHLMVVPASEFQEFVSWKEAQGEERGS